jgi:protein-tyrosine-phosphatase
MAALPGSVLFLCNHNAVRSPLAEGVMKKLFGRKVFVQSAGVREDFDTDGFMIAAAAEIGVDLSRHRPRSVETMEKWGDDVGSFDLIVALSPAAQRLALEYTRHNAVEVDYWPTLDPTGIGEGRERRLEAYRETRDQIVTAIQSRFGAPPA